MSAKLIGNPSHVTTPLTATVTSLTNNGSGAVRVHTSAPHLFGDGDTVLMAVGITALNTYWTIAVIASSTFDLVGSTFTATATGTVTDESLTPQVQVPTDGDTQSLQLSGLLSCQEAWADRTQFLRSRSLFGVPGVIFTASTTLVVPPRCRMMFAMLCGGGGGGEGGKRGEHVSSTTGVFPQGGGGAAAPVLTMLFPTTPGDTLALTVGAPGAGGPARGNAGADGGASFINNGAGFLMALAYGGAGCGSGQENWSGAAQFAAVEVVPGGAFTESLGAVAPGAVGVAQLRASPFPYSTGPSPLGGGYGYRNAADWLSHICPNIERSGGAVAAFFNTLTSTKIDYAAQFGGNAEGSQQLLSALPTVGGSPGIAGAHGAALLGGCGGGGGGASLFANGGTGGNGGSGTSGGAGGDATDAPALPANSFGAGGGGGGCGGDGTTSGGNPGAGATGGPGVIVLYYLRGLS